jgi:Cys-tRNA(Pro)/Cys-tRNA(Cys) deacylase
MPEHKTNAMRMLEKEGISYLIHTYPHGKEAVDGETVAKLLGQNVEIVFKTLVTQGADRNVYVFVVPVSRELDLKKAAKAAKVKSVAMIPVSDITKVTGYVRGGCSPIGMKKHHQTFVDESAEKHPNIIVSAGKIGHQIDLVPRDLIRLTQGVFAPLTTS